MSKVVVLPNGFELTEELMRDFLTQAFAHGYGVADSVPGLLPGSKSFAPFVLNVGDASLRYQDQYHGRRNSAGVSQVDYLEKDKFVKPLMLIIYRGLVNPKATDGELAAALDTLKKTLRVKSGRARLPLVGESLLGNIFYTTSETDYAYNGYTSGDIWDLRYVEVVRRKHRINPIKEDDPEYWFGRLLDGRWEGAVIVHRFEHILLA